MRQFVSALIALVMFSASCQAATIKVNGQLSNQDFYKAVSCGASPGKGCSEDIYRWSRAKAARLTVSLHFPDTMAAADKARFIAALSNGIQTINAGGTGVKLSRLADGKRADIVVTVIDPDSMDLLNQLSPAQKGVTFVAHTNISTSGSGTIKNSQVTLNQRLTGRELQSIMASNLMSSMGFLNNVQGSSYTNNSLMAGYANAQTKLTGQDLVALGMHYPK